MQTRRDLYQAHKLMMQRVGLALLQGEPDIAESPMRRLSVAAFSGAMVAVLIAAIFGVIGLISPGGARDLDKGGSIIIEKETGTKYVYDTKKDQMLPVLNYASAKLALNVDNPPQRVVSRKSLSKYSRGTMIGIPGAPDSLPDPAHLVKKPWSVCVRNGRTTTTGARPVTSLVAGQQVGGQALRDNEAVYVQVGTKYYVIWNDQSLQVSLPPNQASNILQAAPVPVTQTWINQVTPGAAFAAPPIPGRGAPKRGVGQGARVGQVFWVPSGAGKAWYVLMSNGFSRISETQAVLLNADPLTKLKAYNGNMPADQQAQPSMVTSESAAPLQNDKLPQSIPNFVQWDAASPLCSVYAHTDTGSVAAQLTLGGSVPYIADASTQETALDQVVLPPGGAALVGLLPGEGQLNAINSWSIVNDAGISFPLSSKDTVKKLGYDTKDAAPIPKAILSLLPTGPKLAWEAARMPVPPPKAGVG